MMKKGALKRKGGNLELKEPRNLKRVKISIGQSAASSRKRATRARNPMTAVVEQLEEASVRVSGDTNEGKLPFGIKSRKERRKQGRQLKKLRLDAYAHRKPVRGILRSMSFYTFSA